MFVQTHFQRARHHHPQHSSSLNATATTTTTSSKYANSLQTKLNHRNRCQTYSSQASGSSNRPQICTFSTSLSTSSSSCGSSRKNSCSGGSSSCGSSRSSSLRARKSIERAVRRHIEDDDQPLGGTSRRLVSGLDAHRCRTNYARAEENYTREANLRKFQVAHRQLAAKNGSITRSATFCSPIKEPPIESGLLNEWGKAIHTIEEPQDQTKPIDTTIQAKEGELERCCEHYEEASKISHLETTRPQDQARVSSACECDSSFQAGTKVDLSDGSHLVEGNPIKHHQTTLTSSAKIRTEKEKSKARSLPQNCSTRNIDDRKQCTKGGNSISHLVLKLLATLLPVSLRLPLNSNQIISNSKGRESLATNERKFLALPKQSANIFISFCSSCILYQFETLRLFADCIEFALRESYEQLKCHFALNQTAFKHCTSVQQNFVDGSANSEANNMETRRRIGMSAQRAPVYRRQYSLAANELKLEQHNQFCAHIHNHNHNHNYLTEADHCTQLNGAYEIPNQNRITADAIGLCEQSNLSGTAADKHGHDSGQILGAKNLCAKELHADYDELKETTQEMPLCLNQRRGSSFTNTSTSMSPSFGGPKPTYTLLKTQGNTRLTSVASCHRIQPISVPDEQLDDARTKPFEFRRLNTMSARYHSDCLPDDCSSLQCASLRLHLPTNKDLAQVSNSIETRKNQSNLHWPASFPLSYPHSGQSACGVATIPELWRSVPLFRESNSRLSPQQVQPQPRPRSVAVAAAQAHQEEAHFMASSYERTHQQLQYRQARRFEDSIVQEMALTAASGHPLSAYAGKQTLSGPPLTTQPVNLLVASDSEMYIRPARHLREQLQRPDQVRSHHVHANACAYIRPEAPGMDKKKLSDYDNGTNNERREIKTRDASIRSSGNIGRAASLLDEPIVVSSTKAKAKAKSSAVAVGAPTTLADIGFALDRRSAGANSSSSREKEHGNKGRTKLSIAGAKRRLGFRQRTGLSSISVQRSEEIPPMDAHRIALKTLNNSLTDSGNDSGSYLLSPQMEAGTSNSFMDDLGKGQIASRQALVAPYIGEVQLSLTDRRGILEIGVLRARRLKAKLGSSILPCPTCKVYLVRDKKCITKGKTPPHDATLNPYFQYQFIYRGDYKSCVLQLIVWGDYGKNDRKSLMGVAQVNLGALDMRNMLISWYKLFNEPSMVNIWNSSRALRFSILPKSGSAEITGSRIPDDVVGKRLRDSEAENEDEDEDEDDDEDEDEEEESDIGIEFD